MQILSVLQVFNSEMDTNVANIFVQFRFNLVSVLDNDHFGQSRSM